MTSTLKVRNIEMGEGSASASKILFDGNAQDFHIGLDDSEDKLTIGKGSTLGTTTHMTFDADGNVLKPLQCYFNVKKNAHQSNIAANAYTLVTYETELADVGGNFASNTFTAPVTGVYSLSVMVRLDTIDTAATYYNFYLETSNRAYLGLRDLKFSSDSMFVYTMNVIADMDANDTAIMYVNQQGGSVQTQINVDTFFHGYLLG